MKNLKDLLKIPLLTIAGFLFFTSCVKDVDLDQIQEIRLQPKAVVELFRFERETDLIPNVDPGVPIPVEQNVPFEIITSDLEESVVGVALGMEYFNSLPRSFEVEILFLNDRNRVKQALSFEIPAGTEESPVTQGLVFEFKGEELELLNESTQVKLKFEMQPGPGASGGQIQLLSTAAYQFEF